VGIPAFRDAMAFRSHAGLGWKPGAYRIRAGSPAAAPEDQGPIIQPISVIQQITQRGKIIRMPYPAQPDRIRRRGLLGHGARV
jgi:hypothetical protein